MEVAVRPATLPDVRLLADFNVSMALETERKRLDRPTVEAGITRLLEDPALGFYLVAQIGEAVAGCLMVTTEWSDWRNARFWWIQSVFVAEEFRRRGVFRALYEAVRNRAVLDGGVCGIRLCVERENSGAQAVYRTLGMRNAGYLVFEDPF